MTASTRRAGRGTSVPAGWSRQPAPRSPQRSAQPPSRPTASLAGSGWDKPSGAAYGSACMSAVRMSWQASCPITGRTKRSHRYRCVSACLRDHCGPGSCAPSAVQTLALTCSGTVISRWQADPDRRAAHGPTTGSGAAVLSLQPNASGPTLRLSALVLDAENLSILAERWSDALSTPQSDLLPAACSTTYSGHMPLSSRGSS